MINCRQVSPPVWEHARQALVFYFTRRHRMTGAEDLAQETLLSVLGREDFQFESEEDFLRVCYGFAVHVLQTAVRRDGRTTSASSEFLEFAAQPPRGSGSGLKSAELKVYLDQVLDLGAKQLRETEWASIQEAIQERSAQDEGASSSNKERVRLFRARRKLADLCGWRRG